MFEYSVLFFLRRFEVTKAAILYDRMSREGFLPSPALRAHMRIIRLASLGPSEDDLFNIVSESLDGESFNEDALRELLRILGYGLSAPPSFIDRVARAFLAKRSPDTPLSAHTISIIVRLHAQAGDKEGAVRWAENPSTPPPPPARPATVAAPYTTLLRDLGTADPKFSVYQWALKEMQQAHPDIVPDTPFFNALLAHEVGRRKFGAVFAIYERMMKHREHPVAPDPYTFSTTFRAIHRLTSRYARKARQLRNVRTPKSMPGPRAVFRDMLVCRAEHLQYCERTGAAPSSAWEEPVAIHKALRTFLGAYDYAGAYIALQTLRLYAPGTPHCVSLKTYRLIVGALLTRVRVQLPHSAIVLHREHMWAFRLLGLAQLPPGRQTVPTDFTLVHRLLRMGADPALSLDFVDVPGASVVAPPPGLYTPRPAGAGDEDRDEDYRAHGMPTPLEFVGVQAMDGEREHALAIAPLERMLKRAILASFKELKEGEMTPAGYVSAEIKQAESEMFPQYEA